MSSTTGHPDHHVRRLVVGTLAVGAGYVASMTLRDAAEAAMADGIDVAVLGDSLPVLVAGGIVLGGSLSPIAARLSGSRRRHFFVWWTLVFLNTVGVIVEGWAFVPGLVPLAEIPWSVTSYGVVAAVVAGALAVVFAPCTARGPTVPDLPGGRRLLAGLFAGAATYAVLYFVVGALTYALVTGPYYEQHVGGLVNPPLRVVVAVSLFRGVLLSVSLVPLVRTVDDPRRRAWTSALSVGVLAGLLPLLTQVNRLPPTVLAASSVEILLQVCPAAVVVAAVLGTGALPTLRGELGRMWRGAAADAES